MLVSERKTQTISLNPTSRLWVSCYL